VALPKHSAHRQTKSRTSQQQELKESFSFFPALLDYFKYVINLKYQEASLKIKEVQCHY
jgi:hypothetical protein